MREDERGREIFLSLNSSPWNWRTTFLLPFDFIFHSSSSFFWKKITGQFLSFFLFLYFFFLLFLFFFLEPVIFNTFLLFNFWRNRFQKQICNSFSLPDCVVTFLDTTNWKRFSFFYSFSFFPFPFLSLRLRRVGEKESCRHFSSFSSSSFHFLFLSIVVTPSFDNFETR